MKIVFIINPKAGKGAKIENLIEKITTASAELSADVEIYCTKAVGDACRFVEEYLKTNGAARFIACGGDGTLNEVVNGAVGFEGAEVGVLPMGTGNDFCRNFQGRDFADIAAQISGTSIKCDAIKYLTEVGGAEKSGYSVNMFNIGFDCNVADMMSDIKKKTFARGPFAYFLSILVNLIGKKGANLEIALDGEVKHNGPLLLTSLANGSFCGGGVNSNPLAEVNDGLISVNIIRDIPRLTIFRILPSYMKGTFMSMKNIDKIILTEKCRTVTVTPEAERFRICNDGEISDAGRTKFEVVHDAISFVLPSRKTLKKEEKLNESCYSN